MHNPNPKGRPKVDLFSKRLILIPINLSHSHWVLIVVVNPNCLAQHNEWAAASFSDESGFKLDAPCPCIIYMDSLDRQGDRQGVDAIIVENIQAWFHYEWEQKFGTPSPNPFESGMRGMRVFVPPNRKSSPPSR
jgi:Ulp1 family protease